ncbi:ATP-binding cassette domain-containing protein [Luteolibacter yonseiensis]|uniref:ATP-binding cassette domain-containing protein n=1 Tax=Luteolibacter yonseiensis TaxID=1144680 RepID=A0A934VD29_9BACT|nr:polysaccharide ABC transporter ATP-binding protein [Luteolibacter yonseiensis]MBK1817119.1 ATP-binding cassette domain-containing protein [Luteolibacter yonseiensis]
MEVHHPNEAQANEVLIRVEGVSKKFCRDLKKSLWYGTKDVLSELNPFEKTSSGSAPDLRPGEFWANKDVTFELRRGECLGLIGRNGAGKTTLLKILNGLIKPDFGHIEMRGRVGAMIALGAGFNPVLSGRENIYVNGSILGLTKEEIDSKVDDIIEFSEIGDFIDAPVQSYSSGMQVRLGFAVATTLEPDILILDEVLAVGDASFRNKCYKRVSSLRKNAAVIFVSHTMEQVGRICDQVLMLKKGQVHYIGNVADGVRAYEAENEDENSGDDSFLSFSPPINGFEIRNITESLRSGQSLTFEILIEALELVPRYTIRVMFYNASGGFAADGNLEMSDEESVLQPGGNRVNVELSSVPLKAGKYHFALNLIDPAGELVVWSYKQHVVRVTDSHPAAISDCQIPIKASK